MKRGYWFLHTLLLLVLPVRWAATQSVTDPLPVISVKEDSIARLFTRLESAAGAHEKRSLSSNILDMMTGLLSAPSSFNYPFPKLTRVGKIMSSDSSVRIFTWHLAYYDGTFDYFGLVQRKIGTADSVQVFVLNDISRTLVSPEDTVLRSGNWVGCLYYEIATVTIGDTTCYTLIGYDFNTLLTSVKLVDILYFDGSGDPVFGASVFRMDGVVKKRLLFEYSRQVVMVLKYDRESGMIVFDHLSPSMPEFKDMHQYYGPDFSYDGLRFESGQWVLVKDLDLRNR